MRAQRTNKNNINIKYDKYDMSNLVIYVYLLYFVVVKIHEILDPTA